MPATASGSIFDSLPKPDALQSGLDRLPTSVPLPRKLDIDVQSLGDSLLSRVQGSLGDGAIPSPDLSGAPAADAVGSALDGPLSTLNGVSSGNLIGGIGDSLSVEIPGPKPDINGFAQQMTGSILPAGVGSPVDIQLSLPPIFGDFSAPLQKLVQAGAATPLRMLNVLLAVVDGLVANATDTASLKRLTAEALNEIFVAQIRNLQRQLPVAVLTQAQRVFDDAILQRYETLLAQVEAEEALDVAEMLDWVATVEADLLPRLRAFDHVGVVIGNLRSADTEPLESALEKVLEFSRDDAVFLQPYFDLAEQKTRTVIGAITGPVESLSGMMDQISEFLENAASQAEAGAETVSEKLTTTLRAIAEQLRGAQGGIEQIEAQLRDFLEKADIGPAIEQFKTGCTTVVDAVDQFFTQVERARLQLDDAVKQLEKEIDTRFDSALAELEAQIRGILDQLVELLDREEVRQVLDQAREGIEKLKTAIDDASLQSVFDLVVGKTQELEGKIQAIEVEKLGTPQKTALKVGVKVIEQVKVDEVIKPELMDAFAQILEPLRELIGLLKDKVLVIEKQIDEFNPGTLVTRKLDPLLKPVFDALDQFRPSQLLEPLKVAIAELTKVLEKLDPQILVDAIQKAYEELYKLIEQLDPASLTRLISQAKGVAVSELTKVRDLYLEEVIRTIRETVSLDRLLESSGIREIGDAEFWTMLHDLLGGEHLRKIRKAVDDVEKDLTTEFGAIDARAAAAAIAELKADVDAQISFTPTVMRETLRKLREAADENLDLVQELDRRRRAVLARPELAPEVAGALRRMDLAAGMGLPAQLQPLSPEAAELEKGRAKVRTLLNSAETKKRLGELTEEAVQKAVPEIFRVQLGDPVRGFIDAVLEMLKPFTEALEKIQALIDKVLNELPERIDAAVGKVLETIRVEVKGVITEVIATIEELAGALIRTINEVYRFVKEKVEQVNPAWVLNSFVEADLVTTTATGEPSDGLALLAQRIAAPGESDRVAALLQSRIPEDAFRLVRARSGEYGERVLEALNGLLREETLARDFAEAAQVRLADGKLLIEAALKNAEGDAWVVQRKALIRNGALMRQLQAARRAYGLAPAQAATRVRLNRVILEVQYPESLKMGLQALHPYMVEQVASLYPEETVEAIDRIYLGIVTRVKTLPDRMIREPLDDAFDRVKTKLHDTFDIKGLFSVLDIKLDGMSGDLDKGLDRLSVAYRGLLGTLDRRLSG